MATFRMLLQYAVEASKWDFWSNLHLQMGLSLVCLKCSPHPHETECQWNFRGTTPNISSVAANSMRMALGLGSAATDDGCRSRHHRAEWFPRRGSVTPSGDNQAHRKRWIHEHPGVSGVPNYQACRRHSPLAVYRLARHSRCFHGFECDVTTFIEVEKCIETSRAARLS